MLTPNNADGVSLTENLETKPNGDIIISHLILVEKVLRNRPTHHLTENQKNNRSKYLDILNRYWKIGKVPYNDYALGRFPIFIDRKGVHCAVGYLLQQGGFENIAQKINSQQKFAYIHQIKVPELLEWQQKCGLTLDELAWIQPSYPFRANAMALGKGLKGEVKDIKECNGKFSLIAAGKFKIEEDTNFVVLAGFDGINWKPIIRANGIINKIDVKGNNITSYGGDINFGNFNKVEILETDITNSIPTHKLIGDFNGEILDFETYNAKKYVCGKFTGGLAEWKDTNWVVLATSKIDSPTSIRGYGGKLYITGIRLYRDLYTLVSFDGTKFDDKINIPKQASYLQVFNNKLFIGLKSYNEYWTDTLLYSFDGIKLQKFDSIKYLEGREVKNIIIRENKLLLTGELGQNTGSGVYDFGNGLALYDSKLPSNIKPIICVDGIVYAAILIKQNEIIIAGNFTKYYKTNMTEPLYGCGIAYENGKSGIVNIPDKIQFENPFPNPTQGIISFPEPGQLFDINGKLVMEVAQGQNNISELSKGVYIYVCKKIRFRIVKQ